MKAGENREGQHRKQVRDPEQRGLAFPEAGRCYGGDSLDHGKGQWALLRSEHRVT